jgi:hypothetical protein
MRIGEIERVGEPEIPMPNLTHRWGWYTVPCAPLPERKNSVQLPLMNSDDPTI